MEHPDKKIMQRANQLAKVGLEQGEHGVASIIVRGDEIISESFATINGEQDPTCHAEINAIRKAVAKLGSKRLFDCYLYSTYEPCPMCASAAIWARMKGIVYGASHEDETEKNPWRVKISAKEVVEKGDPRLELFSDFLREECRKLLI